MNFSFGIKNGMCFGIDLTSVTDDIIVSPDDCEFLFNIWGVYPYRGSR